MFIVLELSLYACLDAFFIFTIAFILFSFFVFACKSFLFFIFSLHVFFAFNFYYYFYYAFNFFRIQFLHRNGSAIAATITKVSTVLHIFLCLGKGKRTVLLFARSDALRGVV